MEENPTGVCKMGIHINTKLYCDCQKSLLQERVMNKVIEKITGTLVESVYQCPNCNRSIKIVIRLTYTDTFKGFGVSK